MPTRILIAEPDSSVAAPLRHVLEAEGHVVTVAKSGKEALEIASKASFELFVIEVKVLEKEEVSLLHFLRSRSPHASLVLLSDPGEADLAVRAAEQGAALSMLKPVKPEALLAIINRLRSRDEVDEVLPEDGSDAPFVFFGMVGKSGALRRVLRLTAKVAATDSTVVISGESGTGKEMIAKIIQRLSPRSERPFVTLNCGAIPENLVESELFGHEAGAFTDAKEAKMGLFELADGGTIFLDEIGDMPKPAQAKLLEFLETHRFRRVGGLRDFVVDVHVVTATNRNLEEAVKS